MTIKTVSEAFAFVLAQGTFTEAILFAEQDVEGMKPDETAAVVRVLKHTESCYVDLLSECRRVFLVQAAGTSLDANKKLLEYKSRASTIWARKMVQIPLVVQKSWVAWVTIGLWPSADGDRPIELAAHVTVQRAKHAVLLECLAELGVKEEPVGSGHVAARALPCVGQTFEELAKTMADHAVPIAAGLHSKLAAT